MTDRFSNHSTGLSSPAASVAAVTKSDDTDLPGGTCRALLVGTAGTATIHDASGATCTDIPLQQGYNPIRARRVLDSGTADDIWAIY